MATFQVGNDYTQNSWCEASIECKGQTGDECTYFIDNGDGIDVIFLYNVNECDYISESNLVIEIQTLYNGPWYHVATYTMGGYEGFAYRDINIRGCVNYELRATYKDLTKYFWVQAPCVSDWQCRSPLDGYETDVNNCGEKDRLNSSCDPSIDPCEEVVCEPFCDGFDYYTSICVDGECVNTLVEVNSETCGYDPCDGVTCEDYCDETTRYYDGFCAGGDCFYSTEVDSEICGYDPCERIVCDDCCVGTTRYYNGTCVNGSCTYDVELNSEICGYVPPDPCEGVECPDYCDETTRYYNGTCVDGSCAYDTETNSEICGYDPCEEVVCEPFCDGFDYYTSICVDGECVNTLVEINSIDHCGYVPLDEPKEDILKIIISAGIGIGLLVSMKK